MIGYAQPFTEEISRHQKGLSQDQQSDQYDKQLNRETQGTHIQ